MSSRNSRDGSVTVNCKVNFCRVLCLSLASRQGNHDTRNDDLFTVGPACLIPVALTVQTWNSYLGRRTDWESETHDVIRDNKYQ